MTDDKTDHVETLLKKAVNANSGGEAQAYAQAACNAANALCAVKTAETIGKSK